VLDGVDFAFADAPERSFSAVRPPGHHALRDTAMGFCLFGNIAIAAHYARQRHHADRVLIVDWDVHHGNGTQALVQSDPGIHFVSMHQWPWYPGSGAASDRGIGNVWNVPMAPGLARQLYVNALERAVDAATAAFAPDLILISAGFDSLRGDPLGGFTLEPEDLAGVTRRLVQRASVSAYGRVVSALEGGYSLPLLGQGVLAHLHALGQS
jgi:acetoin utilization deacetylase AcuC-like enzyme